MHPAQGLSTSTTSRRCRHATAGHVPCTGSGAARPAGARNDRRRLRRSRRTHRPVARDHRGRRDGRLHRRRIDINNPDFIRPDGSTSSWTTRTSAARAPASPTGGEEASATPVSIAAQGRQVYDVSNYSALPLNRPCDIRIEGVAPGASLVGLDIFGAEDAGFNSSFLAGDRLRRDRRPRQRAQRVVRQQLLPRRRGQPRPDQGGQRRRRRRRTTVVTVSSGDAGVTNTIGTPATDPNVISVGASHHLPDLRPDRATPAARSPASRAGWTTTSARSAPAGSSRTGRRSTSSPPAS